MTSLQVFYEGHVQGVGFRAFTHRNARDLQLKGWVRNLTNGQVEIVAEGPGKSLEELLARVKKGPAGSHVWRIHGRWPNGAPGDRPPPSSAPAGPPGAVRAWAGRRRAGRSRVGPATTAGAAGGRAVAAACRSPWV